MSYSANQGLKSPCPTNNKEQAYVSGAAPERVSDDCQPPDQAL